MKLFCLILVYPLFQRLCYFLKIFLHLRFLWFRKKKELPTVWQNTVYWQQQQCFDTYTQSFSPFLYDKSILCHLFLAFHLFVAVFCFLVSAFFPFDNETLPKNLQLLVVKALYKKERSKTNFKAFLFFFSVYFIFFSSFCSSSSSSRTTHKRKTVVFKQFAQLDGGKRRKKVGGCKRMLLN